MKKTLMALAALGVLSACSTIKEVEDTVKDLAGIHMGPGFQSCMQTERAFDHTPIVPVVTTSQDVQPSNSQGLNLTLDVASIDDGLGNRLERCVVTHLRSRHSTLEGAEIEVKTTIAAIQRITNNPVFISAVEAAAQKRGISTEQHLNNIEAAIANFLNQEFLAYYTLTVTAKGGLISQTPPPTNKHHTTKTSFWQGNLSEDITKPTMNPMIIWRGGSIDTLHVTLELARTSSFHRHIERLLARAENDISKIDGFADSLAGKADNALTPAFPFLADAAADVIRGIGGAVVAGLDEKLVDFIEPRTILAEHTFVLNTLEGGTGPANVPAQQQLTMGNGAALCLVAQLPAGSGSTPAASCDGGDGQRVLVHATLGGSAN